MSHDRPTVAIVCRGSTQVGLGHVMRARSVAEALTEFADTRLILQGDEAARAMLDASAVPFLDASTDDEAAAKARELGCDIVGFDLLTFERAAYEAAADGRTTFSLSPIFDRLDRVQRFFHRTRHLPPNCPISETGTLRTAVRAGLEYAVIREQVMPIGSSQYLSHVHDHDKLSVAVSMGGGDAPNNTLAVLDALSRIERPLLVWALLGEGYAHDYEPLVEAVRHAPQHEIILAKTSASMWRVLGQCSLAVLAGGTVTYEAVCAGLPSINLLHSNEHSFLVRELVEHGVAIAVEPPIEEAAMRAASMVESLDRDRGELVRMHRACQGLIDGHGARRIAHEIVSAWLASTRLRAKRQIVPGARIASRGAA